MSEQIKEKWFIIREDSRANMIEAISDRGNLRYGDGSVRPAKIYAHIKLGDKRVPISHLIAEHFIGKSEDDIFLGRDIVDHITHHPDGMNVNDVRNIRWCTHKENSNFPEAKTNMSIGMTGRPRTDFGQLFLPSITGKVNGKNMNYYAWARNQFKKTGVMPSYEEYSHVYQGRKSKFAQWFNDNYGSGNQNRALYQRCRRHYRETGEFLEV